MAEHYRLSAEKENAANSSEIPVEAQPNNQQEKNEAASPEIEEIKEEVKVDQGFGTISSINEAN